MSEDLPNNEILARYLNREITEDQLLQKSEGLDEFVRLAKMAETLEVPNSTATSTAWARFSKKIVEEEQAKKVVVKPMRRGASRAKFFSIAAAIAGILMVSYFLIPKETSISTNLDQTSMATLPDGSEVSMFASSEITYNKRNWDKDRELDLEGEAFFKVKKGEAFTVHTPKGDVTVLGTSFNVFQRDDMFEVVCYTGKVSVSSNNQTEILTPGEKAILSGSDLSKTQQEGNASEPAWMSGLIQLKNASLSDISELYERYYGYKLTYDSNLEVPFKGVFLTTDLKKSIEVICDPIDLNYIFEDNRTIHLSR